jgi:uroporphyrinogen decarboxylase
MTSRQRILAAINHELPDRIPVHILGLDEPQRFLEYFQVKEYDALLQILDLDTAYVFVEYTGPGFGEGVSIWGTPWLEEGSGRTSTYSQSRGGCPLAHVESANEVEQYGWPSADHYDYSALQKRSEACGNQARILTVGWEPLFCRVLDLFGIEEGLQKLYTHPAVIEAAVAHIANFVVAKVERMLQAAEGVVDIFWYGDDFATQRGLMISPEHWRKLFLPVYERIFAAARNYGMKMWFHSCGSFVEVLPDLIDAGMEVWETCQMHLEANNPAFLKREFGDKLTFFGAINTQQTLPYGTTTQVRQEVRQRIDILGEGGGYICGPDHTVRPEVPIENLLAMIDEAKKHYNPACCRHELGEASQYSSHLK